MLPALESADVGLWLHWPMACSESSAGRCPRQGHKGNMASTWTSPTQARALSRSVRMLLLGTQSRRCDEATQRGHTLAFWQTVPARPQPTPASIFRHVNEKATPDDSSSWLLNLPAEGTDIMGQKQVSLSVPSLNSPPTETIQMIRDYCYFKSLRFGGTYFAATDNWHICLDSEVTISPSKLLL